MRIKKPTEFDPDKEYKIGERFIYNGKTLIAQKYTEFTKSFIDKYKSMFFNFGVLPTQCGMCDVKRPDCKGIVNSPCQKYNRTDRQKVNYKILRK